ncbi:conjugal transfer protein TraD [Xanthomonas translucens]|uniref:Conjugal transfer protein TraD n=2 Tax=Xanthomonas campestris pv. translucens TaxID=343 RepID=A0ABW9KYQ0_XANCT|nr:conjugal transfer protein TraD [Xanthomonas translucens]
MLSEPSPTTPMQVSATPSAAVIEASRRGRKTRDEAKAEAARLEKEINALRREHEVRIRKMERLAAKRQKLVKSVQRREVHQRKFEVGGLALIAGLLNEDRGFLLGILLRAQEEMSSPAWTTDRYQALKQLGDSELAAREASRKSRHSTET